MGGSRVRSDRRVSLIHREEQKGRRGDLGELGYSLRPSFLLARFDPKLTH